MKRLKEKIVSALQKVQKSVQVTHPHRIRWVTDLFLPHPDPDFGESLCVQGCLQQLDEYGCGGIAGFIVLKAIYPKSSWKEFYHLCPPHPDHGLGDGRLLSALRKSGVAVSTHPRLLSFSEIKKAIGDGTPILAAHICPQDDEDPVAHWVAIYGWSDEGDKMVYIANPVYSNPMRYSELRTLSKGYKSYICWGKE